jgi:periplasmic copper chaperone A
MKILSRVAGLVVISVFAFTCLPALAAASGMAHAGSIDIQGGWVRATPNGARTGAAYLTIDNQGGAEDRLTGGTTTAASTMQIHEMKVENGVMSMREVTGGLALPAHAKTELKPGGYHIMLIGLAKPIAAGDDVVLTLHFAKAGDVTMQLPAKDASAMQTMGGAMHMGGAK